MGGVKKVLTKLEPRWWLAPVAAAMTLPLIVVFAPDYGAMQTAQSEEAFRLAIDGSPTWTLVAAALVDIAFALAYTTSAVVIARRASLWVWAPVLVVVAGVLDLVENVLLIVNIVAAKGDHALHLAPMTTVGHVKWAFGLVGVLLLAVCAVARLGALTAPERRERFAKATNAGRLAGWAIGFGLLLAIVAYFARVAAPLFALVLLGAVTVLALGGLARAERLATAGMKDRSLVFRYLLAMLTALAVVAGSVRADAYYGLGFAALGLGLHSLVRAVDYLRRWTGVAAGWAIICTAVSLSGMAAVLLAWLKSGEFGAPLWIAVGVALVGGAFSIELWSACYPALLERNRAVVGILGGIIIAALTTLLLIVTDPLIASVIILSLAGTTALFITAKDAPLLVGLLIIALVWATLPRAAREPEGQVARPNEPYFAVLGDSYMSGEGTTEYFEGTNMVGDGGNECRRSPDSWAMLLNPPGTYDAGDSLGIPERVLNLTCSGAVTADIRRGDSGGDDVERPADDVPKQLTQLENASKVLGKPAFVVVGIGGNDIQFSDIGVSCVLPGDCRTFIEDLSSSRLASVGDEIERTYAEIRVVVGLDVPVVAVPYPRPIHVGPTCRGVVLSEGDVQVINSFTTSLNDEIETAAQHAGAFFMANVEDGLSDSARQLCEPNDAAGLNFIDLNPRGGGFWTVVNPAQWGHNFVHPNELGHRAINAAATRWLAEHPCLLEPPCPKTDATIDLQRVSLERVDAVDDVSYGYDDKVFLALMEALVFVALASLGWWLVITATIGWKAQPQDVDEKSFAEQIVASIVGWRSDDEIAAAAAGHTLASDTSRDVSDDRAPGRGRRRRRT